MKLTLTQQLEAMQAVVDNPTIHFYNIPHYARTFRIIDWDTKQSSLTKEGRDIWERFTAHLNAGYKKLTKNERLFWLTAYTGDPQPDDAQLMSILTTSKSPGIRKAALAYYVNHQGKHGVTGEWRTVIVDILHGDDPDSETLGAVVAPLADETLMRATTGGAAIAAWLTAHPQTDDTTINQWLYNGDGNDVAAVIDGIDPKRIPAIDMERITDGTHHNIDAMRDVFARKARYLTVKQMEALLDHGTLNVMSALTYSGPYTDEQLEVLDKHDHEAVNIALWQYRKLLRSLRAEHNRFFADPDSGFAARVQKDTLSETHEN